MTNLVIPDGQGRWIMPASTPVSLVDATTGSAAAITARAQAPTGNALQVQIGPGDVISTIPVTIEFDHHQIHEGESYEYCWYSPNLNGTQDFRLSVPNVLPTLQTPHLIAEVVSDATLTTLFLYEGVTFTTGSGGQSQAAQTYNRNRNSANTPGTVIYISGTPALNVAALGPNIWQGVLFSGTKGSSTTDRALSEWVLAANTQYLLRITTGNSAHVLVRIYFYEDQGV